MCVAAVNSRQLINRKPTKSAANELPATMLSESGDRGAVDALLTTDANIQKRGIMPTKEARHAESRFAKRRYRAT